MNIYEQFLGIFTSQKCDFKKHQLHVNHNDYKAYWYDVIQRYKEGLTKCKEAITLLIIKNLILV
jgi:hypothetical protein